MCPLSFPIGMGYDFSGIYNIFENTVSLLKGNEIKFIEKDQVKDNISSDLNNQFIENVELLEMVYPKFDKNEYLMSKIQPVFFGSALNNFGVEDLLRCFIDIAPTPQPKESSVRIVKPVSYTHLTLPTNREV